MPELILFLFLSTQEGFPLGVIKTVVEPLSFTQTTTDPSTCMHSSINPLGSSNATPLIPVVSTVALLLNEGW